MEREVSDGSIMGGIIGIVVWLFDFRHLVIEGPPETVISDAIRNVLSFGGEPLLDSLCSLGRSGVNKVCLNLATLFILVAAGFILGGLISRLFQKADGRG